MIFELGLLLDQDRQINRFSGGWGLDGEGLAVIAAEDGQQSKQVEQGSDHEP